jgi:hypothetical protein
MKCAYSGCKKPILEDQTFVTRTDGDGNKKHYHKKGCFKAFLDKFIAKVRKELR